MREVSGDPPPGDRSQPMRAANVAAPPTTTRAKPPTGAVTPQRARPLTVDSRVKTQWTGSLVVPEVAAQEPGPPPARSKLPLIIGAAVVVIGGGVAAFVATRTTGPATGVDQGSNVASAAPVDRGSAGSAAVAVTPPPPPQPPPPPPLPDMVVITLDSKPQGATVRDLTLDKTLGKTPLKVKLAGSREPRNFAFHLHGYGDTTVEIPLTKDTIAYTEQLVKGASTAAPVVHKVADETLETVSDIGTAVTHPDLGTATVKPDSAGSAAVVKPPETKPDTGSAAAVKPPETKPDTGSAAKPPEHKDPECDDSEVPCLKGFGSNH